GSSMVLVDGNGSKWKEQWYYPFGEKRYPGTGDIAIDRRFTGQRWDGTIGLYDYRARYYDPVLGRFVQPDSIIPDYHNPQSLNRYSYVYNNPLRYTDPTGHCSLCYLVGWYVGRATYEASTLIVPGADRMRRDQIGGQLVTQMSDTITRQAMTQGVDQSLVSAILRHESAAFERRLLTPLPVMGPGVIANAGEAAQALIQGDTASIGPGQMQLRRARELEQLGYVTARSTDLERVRALLGRETAVEYVTGMVRYLSDQLHTVAGFTDLNTEQQQRLILIGYNLGWEGKKGLEANIEKHGFKWVIDYFGYDNQTLDEYLRWKVEH
ncbi:RHS repeat-associated core domain-containing protein, partial [Candidatus Parcubacteria bacterium]